MLEQAVISVLSLIGNLAAPYVIRQLSPLWGSLEDELGKLQRSFLAIQLIVRNAEERQFTEGPVKIWLDKLRDAVYDAEDALEAFDNERRRRHGSIDAPVTTKKKKVREFFSLGNKVFRFKLLREVRDVAARIEMIVAEMAMFNFKPDLLPADHRRPPLSRPIFGPSVCETEIVGRRDECDYVVESLISEIQHQQDQMHINNLELEVISIMGMGGAGKTKLAQMVYNDQRVVDHFKLRMWVSAPTDFDVGEIIKSMISSAKVCHFSSTGMDVLENKLKEVLREKKYLLVLDDVWNEDWQKWDNLSAILLACEADQESRILTTTRNKGCSAVMRSQNLLHLSCLSDEDSWTLFERLAFRTPPSQELASIGKEIIKKCGGLPLAIKAIGSLMLNKTGIGEWTTMLESEIWNLGIDKQGILPALKLSYSHLSPHSKKCSAFCAIFPKGYEMSKEILIQLWKASGFVDPKSTGDDIFDELTHRSFFQEVGYKKVNIELIYFTEYSDIVNHMVSCRMHDLFHDLAYSLIRDELANASTGSKITNEIPKSIRHLLVEDSLPSMNPSIRMRTILMLKRKASFWKNYRKMEDLDSTIYKKLRILALCDIKRESKLYKLIWQFEHLRYLDLSCNESIEELPETIGRLLNLQTLKLSKCTSLRKLPQAITRMSNLTHLHIDGCTELERMPANMSRLTSLQTLSKFIVLEEEGCGISELKHLDRLGGVVELHNLQAVANAAHAAEANLASKGRLHTLALYWEEPLIYDLLERKELEQVAASTTATILLKWQHEEVLEALKPPGHDRSGDGVSALREFRLYGYMGSQLPTWMMNDMHAFQNLKMIYMGRCRRCTRLPQLWRLQSLEVLVLEHMHSVERLVDERVEEEASSTTTTTMFPSLETLVLRGMKELSEWWPAAQGCVDSTPCFPKLIQLVIRSCKKMERCNLPRLPSLRNLAIKNNNGMVYWPEKELRYLRSLEKLRISSCINLTAATHQRLHELDDQLGDEECEDMPPIRFLMLSGCERLDSLPRQVLRITCLKTLHISHCPAMTSLGVEMGRRGGLSALMDLKIRYCPALESLPQGLVSLRRLQVWGCPKIAAFPQDLCLRLPALRSLKLNGCPELQTRCRVGGEYLELISTIADVDIDHNFGGSLSSGGNGGTIRASRLHTALRTPCCSSRIE